MQPFARELASVLSFPDVGCLYLKEIENVQGWMYFSEPEKPVEAVGLALSNSRGASRFLWKLAREEACGASMLAHVRDTVAPVETRDNLARHAREEARHAGMYLALARKCAADARSITQKTPEVDAREELGPQFCGQFQQFVISIHLAEIRNFLLVNAILAVATDRMDQTFAFKLAKLTARLLQDELWHIKYTGEIVSQTLENDRRYGAVFRSTIDQYSRAQEQELKNIGAFARAD